MSSSKLWQPCSSLLCHCDDRAHAQVSCRAASVHAPGLHAAASKPKQKGLKCAKAVCIEPTLCDVGPTLPRVHRPPRWEQEGHHEQIGISGGTMLAADSGCLSSGRCQGCLRALPSIDGCIRLGSCASQQRMHSLACARRPAMLCRALCQKRTSVQLHCHAGTCCPVPVSWKVQLSSCMLR